MSYNKLNLYEIFIPGDFGLNLNVPIWIDNVQHDFSSVINYCQKNIVNKNLHFLNLHKETEIWNKENVFKLNEPFIDEIKLKIKKSYEDFMKYYGKECKTNLWINGWFNVTSHHQYVKKHCHALHQNSYLTGVIVIKDNGCAKTNFYLPQFEHIEDVGVVSVKNTVGDIMFFPQWLYHSVDRVDENIRITLAFDFFTEEAIKYYHENFEGLDKPIKNAIKF